MYFIFLLLLSLIINTTSHAMFRSTPFLRCIKTEQKIKQPSNPRQNPYVLRSEMLKMKHELIQMSPTWTMPAAHYENVSLSAFHKSCMPNKKDSKDNLSVEYNQYTKWIQSTITLRLNILENVIDKIKKHYEVYHIHDDITTALAGINPDNLGPSAAEDCKLCIQKANDLLSAKTSYSNEIYSGIAKLIQQNRNDYNEVNNVEQHYQLLVHGHYYELLITSLKQKVKADNEKMSKLAERLDNGTAEFVKSLEHD